MIKPWVMSETDPASVERRSLAGVTSFVFRPGKIVVVIPVMGAAVPSPIVARG
jgi:hypothetical protein